MTTLDIPTVQAFLLVADLQSFTRAAEVLGTTQAGVSMKLQRLEATLQKRLVERSPRAVRLTADGAAFQNHARALIAAHDRALSGSAPVAQQLTLGISDHAAGPELLLDAFDGGELDAIVVRQEGSRRGGEVLCTDDFGWFASPAFQWNRSEPLRVAALAAPCGVRAMAVRALDKSRVKWTESFVGGGVSAVVAAAAAGLAVAPLARRIAPAGMIDVGTAFGLPKLGASKVMLHSRVSDASKKAALRVLAATFRKEAGAK